MTELPFPSTSLEEGVRALKDDLLAPGGPRISTMRNYRFAILQYRPSGELKLRRLVRRMTDDLQAAGWNVLAISLQKLLLDRIRATGGEAVESIVARERRLHARDPERALEHLREKIAPHIEGPGGLAADVARHVDAFAEGHPGEADRTVVLIGRGGALYPFFRTSALLKHLDGRTQGIPIVLLYPGERRDGNALSFMGELLPNRDYRPRIYP